MSHNWEWQLGIIIGKIIKCIDIVHYFQELRVLYRHQFIPQHSTEVGKGQVSLTRFQFSVKWNDIQMATFSPRMGVFLHKGRSRHITFCLPWEWIFTVIHSPAENEAQATEVLFQVEFRVEKLKFPLHVKRTARTYLLCVYSKVTHCLSFKTC